MCHTSPHLKWARVQDFPGKILRLGDAEFSIVSDNLDIKCPHLSLVQLPIRQDNEYGSWWFSIPIVRIKEGWKEIEGVIITGVGKYNDHLSLPGEKIQILAQKLSVKYERKERRGTLNV